MSNNAAYQDYKSVWSNKTRQQIEDEIHVINKYSNEVDKYLSADHIKSNERLDILTGILKRKGDNKCK